MQAGPRPHTAHDYVLSFKNYGSTPAQIASYFWTLKVLDSLSIMPMEPVYEGNVFMTSKLLAPNEQWEVATRLRPSLKQARWFSMEGCALYTDQFRERVHHTRFCFLIPNFQGPEAVIHQCGTTAD
jgi:hypothetical protein